MTTTAPTPSSTTEPAAVASGGVTTTATETPVLSILALISAISGIVFGLVIPLSIVAIVLGVLAMSREPQARTMAVWSIVLGSIPGALAILGIVLGAALVIPFGIFALAFGL